MCDQNSSIPNICKSEKTYASVSLDDEKYMREAIRIAGKGEGHVNPNPLVGAVIVKDGQIIGEGFHEMYGGLHAERNAFADAKKKGISAEGATLYVTLEPCCHYGKTPPCTDAIIENKIKRVVTGSKDPNPKVNGKGAAILRAAGICVDEGVLRDRCNELNRVFFHYIKTGMPYVVMKYAMTADGKIATKTGASKWISGRYARNQVHMMRSRYMGIMAGIGTVVSDDPMLNCRYDEIIEGSASEKIRQPIRIICDSKLSISPGSRICQSAEEYKTVLAYAVPDQKKIGILQGFGVDVMYANDGKDRVDLKTLMKKLGEAGIDSVLVEGGGTLNYSMLQQGLVNEIKAYIAPKIFGGNGKTPVGGDGVELPDDALKLKIKSVEMAEEDILVTFLPED